MDKRLSIYQMFPRNYLSETGNIFEEMEADLGRIKELGFNTIYVNPLSEPGYYPKIDQGLVGSMYATRRVDVVNPSFFKGTEEERQLFLENGDFAPAGKAIHDFCKKSVESEVYPIFDLVMGHLTCDSPYIQQALQENPPIMLVAHHENGNYNIHNLDKEYNVRINKETEQPYTGDLVWDDVVTIDWNNRAAKDWVINNIFDPYVRQMAKLGFTGIRIDAPCNVPSDVMQHMVDVFTKECRKDCEPIIYPELLGSDRDKINDTLVNLAPFSNVIITSGNYHPNDDDRKNIIQQNGSIIAPHQLNDPAHWLTNEIGERRSHINNAIIPASSHDYKRLIDNVTTTLVEGGVNQESEDFQEQLQRSIRIKLAYSVMFADGWMLASGDEYLSEKPYAVLEGKLIPQDKGSSGTYAIGTKEDGSPIVLSAETYTKLMAQISNEDSTKIEVEGQSFTFKKGEYFEKPVWKYTNKEVEEKIPHLVIVTPQDKIQELAKASEADMDDSKSLLSFIKDLNKHLQERPPISDIPRDARTYIEFSGENKDIMYFMTADNAWDKKPNNEKNVYEIHAVNISPTAKEFTIDADAMKKDICAKFGLSNEETLPEIKLVGQFNSRQRTPSSEVTDLSVAHREPLMAPLATPNLIKQG